MAKVTVVFGLILIVLGLASYFGTAMVSLTALIPSAVGLLLLVFGVLGMKPTRRKHMMHIAVLVGVLGALASGGRGLGQLFSDQRSVGLAALLAMFAICLAYVVVCVRSFVVARRD